LGNSGLHRNDFFVICIKPQQVTPQMNESLSAEFMLEEVKKALFQMFPTKAPGPDGYPAHFF
jgi:hypothetical protein